VQGTDRIEEVKLIRDGAVIYSLEPGERTVGFKHEDLAFPVKSSYCVRVTQADLDEHGNLSRAWLSLVWGTKKQWSLALEVPLDH
jgi:hypothetical protein